MHDYFQQVYMQFIFLQMLNIIVITIINSDQKIHLLYDPTGCVCYGLLSQVVFFYFFGGCCICLACTRNQLLRIAFFFMELVDYILLEKKFCMFNYSNKFLESQILEAEPILSAAIEDDTRQE